MPCWQKVQRLKNSQTELERLKELLLADELEQIKKLESKVKKLDFEAQDNATIMKRVTPAISKGIADNKETMIDALYPIMGGMISKYVTQAIKEIMETINRKVEDGFSFDKYKRKIKAKVSGVSESELLLEESSDATISSLFVIHKESSLLIAETYLKDKKIDDAHMVASMASAIKDFINDWIKHDTSNNEVQILSYGNATLYIESAGSVYLIAFLDTEPDYELRKEINTVFASVVKKYADFFQQFDGSDTAKEIQTLSEELELYLNAQSNIEKQVIQKKNPAKYFLYFISFLLLAYGIYLFNAWYIKNSLENIIYVQTGEHVTVSRENDHLVLSGQVASTDVIYEIENIMKRHKQKNVEIKLLVPMTYLDKRFKNERMSGKHSVSGVEKKLLFLERNFTQSVNSLQEKILHLQEALNGSKQELKQLLKNTTNEIFSLKEEKEKLRKIAQIKSEIFAKLDKAFIGNPFYNQKDHSLDFRNLPLFMASKAVYKEEAIQKLAEVFVLYMTVIVEYKPYIKHIIIEGHSDSTGMEDENMALSKKRALTVKYYLERLRIVKQYHMQNTIKIEAYGSQQAIIVDNIEDKEASRRIKIKFKLDEYQILDNLRRIIND
jgi:outer membrane protein OmpA-like peptidoglycan-associated protein